MTTIATLLLAAGALQEGRPAMAAAPSPTYKISNVILRVADLPRALAFYRDRLGMTVRFSNEEFAFLDAGGVTLMLNKPEGAVAGESAGLAALTEVVLEVPDIRAAYETLKARGVPFRLAPRVVTTDATRELQAADFRDPDGHVLSITGWVEKR